MRGNVCGIVVVFLFFFLACVAQDSKSEGMLIVYLSSTLCVEKKYAEREREVEIACVFDRAVTAHIRQI